MVVGITLIVVVLLIAGVWLLIEVKRLKHKLFAIFLIALILITYFGFLASVNGRGVDFSTASGWVEAGGLYFSWISGIFVKAKQVTMYAVGLDWKNETDSIQDDT